MIKKRASLEENFKTKRAINNDNLEAFDGFECKK